MGILRKLLLFGFACCATGLLGYEIVARSGPWPGGPLPGWYEARLAERRTAFVPWTGLMPLDLLLHEGQEAAGYYSLLLRPGPREATLASRSARIPR